MSASTDPVVSVHGGFWRRLFALTPDDRVLQFASLGWDTCLEEILPALTTGAALVFDDGVHCGSMPRFVRTLAAQDQRAAPALEREVVPRQGEAGRDLFARGSTRTDERVDFAVLDGELTGDLFEAVLHRHPDAELELIVGSLDLASVREHVRLPAVRRVGLPQQNLNPRQVVQDAGGFRPFFERVLVVRQRNIAGVEFLGALAGVLVEWAGWPTVFWINVPFVAIGVVISAWLMRRAEKRREREMRRAESGR